MGRGDGHAKQPLMDSFRLQRIFTYGQIANGNASSSAKFYNRFCENYVLFSSFPQPRPVFDVNCAPSGRLPEEPLVSWQVSRHFFSFSVFFVNNGLIPAEQWSNQLIGA